ncbi:MAG: ABC transporter, partial [Clostridiales bacterium]
LFGTALSSIINMFLSSQGQISAVGTIVSAGYGFICGAYMPISQFGAGLQKVVSFLPGTYGTSLIRNHALRGVFAEMQVQGFPAEVIEGIRDSIDCNLYFFGNQVTLSAMYWILGGAVVLLIGVYVLLNILMRRGR